MPSAYLHRLFALLASCILLAAASACQKSPSNGQSAVRNEDQTVQGSPEAGMAAADQSLTDPHSAVTGDSPAQDEMVWRAYIDPGLSMAEIEALSPDEARARLTQLNVPLEPMNFHESIEVDPVELTALFLKAGMPVETPNAAGVSPLQVAAFKQKEKHLELLLQHGADVNYMDPRFHATAVDFAVGGGNLAILERLLANGAAPGGGPESRPILIDAIGSNSMEMFNYVFARFPDANVADSDGQNALMNACMVGNLEMTQALVEAGADIDQPERLGGTPVSAAAFSGNWDIMRYLMEQGADPLENHRGNRNMLYEFAFFPEFPLDLAQDFVERGMNVNQVVDNSLSTPLINAARNGNLAMVDFLLKNGADAGLRDKDGYAACDYANVSADGDMVLLFASYGISSDMQIPEGSY